jgi:hypothetical protein
VLRKAELVDAMTSEQAKDLRVSGALKSHFFHGVVIMFCFKKRRPFSVFGVRDNQWL